MALASVARIVNLLCFFSWARRSCLDEIFFEGLESRRKTALGRWRKSMKSDSTEILKGEEKLVLDHSYDGIRELDHLLPRWWVWLFFGTVVFAAWYAGYYMFGSGPTPQQELAQAMLEHDSLKPAPAQDGSAALLAVVGKPENIKHGHEVFALRCVACHGEAGQGGIGPNLTDDYWLHGKGTPQDIAQVVATGVLDKGMPPWGEVLTADEARDVVVFVASIHDTHPTGAKVPQGEKYEER